ncbi:MAG: AraC family transcriptional regulator [Aquabacterium sp.]
MDLSPNTLLPAVPAALPRLLVKLAVERGVDQQALLKAARVHPERLEQVEGHLTAPEYATLIYHALEMTGDPCFGIEMGLNVPPTLFGFLGLALMCASTHREAVEMGVRYMPLGTRFVDVDLDEVPGGITLSVSERWPLGCMLQFGIESTMAAWLNCAGYLGGPTHAQAVREMTQLSFTWERPAAFERYAHRLPATSFSQAANQILVPDEFLDRPVQSAQPHAARQARAQCESELDRIAGSNDSFVAQVAEALVLSELGFPTLEQVAARMHISARTLSRRLDRLGLTFRQVIHDRRMHEARSMLRTTELSVDAIATRLGYLNPANFTRAFKKWTGVTPSSYRDQSRAASH